MRFRRSRPGGFDRASTLLAPRSIYHLTGEVRHEWEHSIAEMDVTRWSITFRSLSVKGHQLCIRCCRSGSAAIPNHRSPTGRQV
jgi:DNA oxidative demethylase